MSTDWPASVRSVVSIELTGWALSRFRLRTAKASEDIHGPLGTPITDSARVTMGGGCSEAWMVVSRPEGAVDDRQVSDALDVLLRRAPIATLR